LGKYGVVYKMVLQNMIQAKLLHWQCALYGQHKALDGLFGTLVELGDTLAESIMGKYGKPVLSDEDLSIKLYNFVNPKDGDLSEFMDHLYKCYTEDCRELFDRDADSEIVNIIDEIIAAVDQTKYLISLR
jgi:DNA-binding ferritin-like protein